MPAPVPATQLPVYGTWRVSFPSKHYLDIKAGFSVLNGKGEKDWSAQVAMTDMLGSGIPRPGRRWAMLIVGTRSGSLLYLGNPFICEFLQSHFHLSHERHRPHRHSQERNVTTSRLFVKRRDSKGLVLDSLLCRIHAFRTYSERECGQMGRRRSDLYRK